MNEEQFYLLWEKFAESNLLEALPEDIIAECKRLSVSVDYYLQEFV